MEKRLPCAAFFIGGCEFRYTQVMKLLHVLLPPTLWWLTTSVTLGCSMHEHDNSLIARIILKPAGSIAVESGEPLSAAYLQDLQTSLPEVRLSYLRSMGLGAHVLGIEPAQPRETVSQLTDRLSARVDVEYAEPDFPRQRH